MKKPDWRLWIINEKECECWLKQYLKKEMLKISKDESNLHLRKTNHNLNLANWIFEKQNNELPEIFSEEKFYDWIITMYYYAVYHASSALLSKEGYRSKNHSATLCFLIYHHYHKKKAIDKEDVNLIAASLEKEDIETIGTSKELREKACYNVHETFEKLLAENIKEQAINFTNKIRTLIEK